MAAPEANGDKKRRTTTYRQEHFASKVLSSTVDITEGITAWERILAVGINGGPSLTDLGKSISTTNAALLRGDSETLGEVVLNHHDPELNIGLIVEGRGTLLLGYNPHKPEQLGLTDSIDPMIMRLFDLIDGLSPESKGILLTMITTEAA